MNEIVNQLAQSLFKKNSLQECSRWELEILADHYPYFGIAQFLLTGKLKEEKAEHYDQQLEKTSLYFTNPLWLDYVINDKSPVAEVITTLREPGSDGMSMENILADNAGEPDLKTEAIATTSLPTEESPAPVREPELFFNGEIIQTVPDLPEENIRQLSEFEENTVANSIEKEDLKPEISVSPAEPILVEDPAQQQVQLAEPVRQESHQTFPEDVRNPEAEVPDLLSAEQDTTYPANPSPVTEPVSEADTSFSAAEPTGPETEAEDTEFTDNPGEELKMRTFTFDSPAGPAPDAPLTFEPYHTVDYFASQGIKMVQPEKSKDRFDQQLKSFTQWLKTIRTIPVTEIARETGADAENKIISLAEHSIADREIVTEAMAAVWVKQGNREKAIELYHKLSLQNTAKSAYFAGLIEQLKQQ